MNNQRIVELAAAIRMTCSNPDVAEKNNRPPPIVALDDSEQGRALAGGEGRLREVAEQMNLRPPLQFPATATASRFAERLSSSVSATQAPPNIVAVDGVGLFGVGRSRAEALRYVRCLLDRTVFESGGEDEAPRHRRLPGRVAVVTGSAQGFGKGIAEELAREGAHVVIADLNDELGIAARDAINETNGEGSAVFCHTDVTDSESLQTLVTETFRAYGGLDIFVSNAGVLRAGGVHEMEPETFALVTKVNYTAFFLCTKAVAPALKLQHMYNPHHFTDIVQINSKSGLQGSNRNFAYAGSKFGSIGLVQSFAMELIEHNVKVNAICPGNFFEGPLWSDPDNGLFVQYLKTGKVPGARTLNDVKRFYMNKVPMRRGCSPTDVAKAILYAHDQEYETGQAIPVTGGQIMLS